MPTDQLRRTLARLALWAACALLLLPPDALAGRGASRAGASKSRAGAKRTTGRATKAKPSKVKPPPPDERPSTPEPGTTLLSSRMPARLDLEEQRVEGQTKSGAVYLFDRSDTIATSRLQARESYRAELLRGVFEGADGAR